jgi:ribosomal protein L4
MSPSTSETQLILKGSPNTMIEQHQVLLDPLWRGGRVVYGSGLENQSRLIPKKFDQ